MRLEGTLDAFGLPDIFQLLAFTKKTGALELRQPGRAGVVHLRDGAVSAASSDVHRQQVVRRLIGAGLVGADQLTRLDESVPSVLLALVADGSVKADAVSAAARDQAFDAVFDLLRWTEGEFSFVVDRPDLDDLDLQVPVEEIVTEGRRRIEQWESVADSLPGPDQVLRAAGQPGGDVTLGVEEWSLLALVDGRRTVAELVDLVGRGEFWTSSRLAALLERGLLVVSGSGDGDPVVAALAALAQRETGVPTPPRPSAAAPKGYSPDRADDRPDEAPVDDRPADDRPVDDWSQAPSHQPSRPRADERPEGRPELAQPQASLTRPTSLATVDGPRSRVDHEVVPPRSEVLTPRRTPEFPDTTAPLTSSTDPVGSMRMPVEGSAAMQPEHDLTEADGMIGRDPSINKSLLLRLIAGVRGL